ncbi:MAG: hypothetical protein M3Q44_07100 [bacterium]|nr:hypothetical protein [bacterium]
MSLIQIEKYLQEIILPELENGRENWDKPHTISVVHYLKLILKNSPQLVVDEEVLTISAYAHDWGYAGIFKKGVKVQEYISSDAKKLHMELGAKRISQLLEGNAFSMLTSAQKSRIVHLVAIHDSLKILTNLDEFILMEADTLGALDISFVTPTFDAVTNEKYMNTILKERLPLFVTAYGKSQFLNLFEQRKSYFSSKRT